MNRQKVVTICAVQNYRLVQRRNKIPVNPELRAAHFNDANLSDVEFLDSELSGEIFKGTNCAVIPIGDQVESSRNRT